MKNIKHTMVTLIVVLTFGIVALAFAHDGYGPRYGDHMMGYGGGYGHMMGYGPGSGHMRGWSGPDGYGDLSREEAAQLEEMREKFTNQTRDLRNAIRDKRFALNDEIEKSNPDRAKVSDLQKQISALEAEFDQKTLAHRLELRERFPQRTYGGDYGRGGYCW